MQKWEIHLSDLKRILLGDAPAMFLVEVFFRTIVSYIVLLVIIRLLGKRMSGKITQAEMAVMLMFGAIVSGSMQIPDRGVIQALFVLVLVLLMERGLTLLTVKNPKSEDRTLGQMAMLVKDGVMCIPALKAERISRSQLFRTLRAKDIRTLGEVKRMYMETNGSFSIFKWKGNSGLTVLPEMDDEVDTVLDKDPNKTVCNLCGHPYPGNSHPARCENCNSDKFTQAKKGKDAE